MKITASTSISGHTGMPLANMLANNHEKIIYYYDEPTNLRVIVAIHNTVLGPALGGTRIWNYAREEDALLDVLRLGVILGDATKIKTESFLRKYGRFIEELNGHYIAGPDVNVTMDDLIHMAKETQYVVGLPALQGGGGDCSLATAYGTYMGMKAAAKLAYGSDSLKGKKIGVEGVGKVGSKLLSYLLQEEAKVYITDILAENLVAMTQQYKLQVIEATDHLYDLDMDIYAPCALGATINDNTLSRLKCQIIAGAANNQLADEARHGHMLVEKGILYVPDFVINAGGVINVHTEFYGGYNEKLAFSQIERIYEVCFSILTKSAEEHISSQEMAIRLAEQRITAIREARLH